MAQRKTKRMFALCLLLVGISTPILGHAQVSGLNELKAIFLFNFARFVHWPAELDGHRVFNLCTWHASVLHGPLSEFQNKVVNGKQFNVKQIDDLKEASSCSIIYLDKSSEHLDFPLPTELKNVLLVSDTPDFAKCHGHIEFALNRDKANKLSLIVNRHNTAASGLNVSSRVLVRSTVLESSQCAGDSDSGSD